MIEVGGVDGVDGVAGFEGRNTHCCEGGSELGVGHPTAPHS